MRQPKHEHYADDDNAGNTFLPVVFGYGKYNSRRYGSYRSPQ